MGMFAGYIKPEYRQRKIFSKMVKGMMESGKRNPDLKASYTWACAHEELLVDHIYPKFGFTPIPGCDLAENFKYNIHEFD